MTSEFNNPEEEEELTVIEELPENVASENKTGEENIFSNYSSFKSDTTDPKIYSARAYFSKQIALTRDRAAAFFLDLLLISYLLGSVNTLFQKMITHQAWFLKMKPIMQNIVWGFLIFLVMVLYFTLFESILGASIGKIICRLRVIHLNGKTASLAKNLVRNFFRLIDLPIFGLIALFSMENSPLNQRLGDRFSETIVIKKTRKRMTPILLKNIPLANLFTRLIAFVIDSIFYLTFLWFYAANLNPESKTVFLVLFNLAPFFILCYFMIFDFLVSSTPGKILIGRKTVLENGEPLDGTSAILRNLLKPLDLILGYPLIALTRKKQRLGDLVAETVVIKKSEKSSLIAIASLLLIIGVLAFFSRQNPHRDWLAPKIKSFKNDIFHASKALPVLPSVSNHPTSPTTQPSSLPKNETIQPPLGSLQNSPLKITEFYFSAGADPSQIRTDTIFHRGDLVFTFFKLTGFQKDNSNKISLFEDVMLKNPQGKSVLNETEVIHLNQNVEKNVEVILYANQLQLPADSPLGNYQLTLILRDEIGKTKLIYEKNFLLQ